MAEVEAELSIAQHAERNEDCSDNESVVSNEPDNSRLFSRLENEIKVHGDSGERNYSVFDRTGTTQT